MSSSTLTPDLSAHASTGATEESSLFDELGYASSTADDSGVLSNNQAQSLLEAMRDDREGVADDGPADPVTTAEHDAHPASGDRETDFDLSLDPCELDEQPLADPAGADVAFAGTTTMTGKPMPDLPQKGEIAALGVRRPGTAPKRIGSGRLVPVRLTWKPRDPLAGPTASQRSHFRWDTMLTTACIMAACGIGGIWLLRSILP